MGRKNEFKVSKAFTLGLEEVAFLKVASEEGDMNASQFLNKLLRKAMLKARKEEEIERKPAGHCHKCNQYRGYDLIEKEPTAGAGRYEWVCEVCGLEKTEYISEIVKRQS